MTKVGLKRFFWILLSPCVFFGTWAMSAWNIGPHWGQLAIAGIVGFVAGTLAPRRIPAWLAWLALVILAWVFYAGGAWYGLIPIPMRLPVLVFPVAASVGVAIGLVWNRVPSHSMGRRLMPVVLGAAAITGLVFLNGPLTTLASPGRWQPPAFTLQLANGSHVSSKSLAGKTVVLSFWATWCGPCLEELPELQRFYTTHYAGRNDVRFILVDEDRGAGAAGKADARLARDHMSITSALDPDGKLGFMLKTSGVLPTRVVIDPRNWVVLTKFGYSKNDSGFPALRTAINTEIR